MTTSHGKSGLRMAPEALGEAEPDDDLRLLTVKQVAEFLQLGRDTTYALIRTGELPSIRFGGFGGHIEYPGRPSGASSRNAPGMPMSISLKPLDPLRFERRVRLVEL